MYIYSLSRRLSLIINNQNYKRNEDNVKIKLDGSHKKPTIKTTTILNCQRRVSSTKTKLQIDSRNKSTSNYQQNTMKLDE